METKMESMGSSIDTLLWNSENIDHLMDKQASYQEFISSVNTLIENLRNEFAILSHSVKAVFDIDSEEGRLITDSANKIVNYNNDLIELFISEVLNKGNKEVPKVAETDSVVVKKVEKQPDTERARKKIPAVIRATPTEP